MFQNLKTRVTAAVQAFSEPEAVQSYNPVAHTGPGLGVPTVNEGRGNQFTDYKSQVDRGWLCWKSRAQYGNLQVRSVLRFWRSWLSGNGANLSGENDAENNYVDELLEHSALDSVLTKRIVLGYLIEGRGLILLQNDGGPTRLRYLRWCDYRYRLIRSSEDRSQIIAVEFNDSNGRRFVYEEADFIYFSEDEDDDEPTPPIAPVLTPAMTMEQAKADWRDLNHFWGSLGLNWQTTGPEALKHSRYIARVLQAKDGQWQYGDTTAFPAEGKFPEPSGRGQESLKREIDMDARFISGYAGIGIHLLGWASEMSNRATASELDEARIAATSDPRERIEDGLSRAANAAYRRDTGRRGRIKATLTPVAMHQLKELTEIWIPLEQGGYIPKSLVIDRIPGIDPVAVKEEILGDPEQEEQERENAALLERIRKEEREREDAA